MDYLKKLLNQFSTVMNQMTMSQKATIMMFFGVVLISLLMLMMWGSRPEKFPVADANDPRAAEIRTKLREAGIEIELNSGKVLIDSKDKDRAILELAANNLLAEGSDFSWDQLLNDPSLTVTKDLRNMKYKRALEVSLGKILAKLNSVKKAHVSISQTEKSPFLRNEPPVKASVMIVTQNRRRLEDQEVDAIINIISFAVKGLDPRHVAVSDPNGTYQTQDPSSASGLAQQLDKLQQFKEFKLAEKARMILSYMPEVIAVATVELDREKIKKEIKVLDQDGKGAIALHETKEQEKSKALTGEQGDVGVTPNSTGDVKDGNSGNSSESSRKYSQTDSDVSHEITMIDRIPGTTLAKSIAVTIPTKEMPLTDEQKANDEPATRAKRSKEEIEEIKASLKNALGMKSTDDITVMSVNMEIDKVDEPSAMAAVIDVIKGGLREAILVIIIFTVLLIMRSMMRSAADQIKNERDREYEFLESQTETLEEPEVLSAQARLLQEKVSEMIHDNPQRAARLVTKWVKD